MTVRAGIADEAFPSDTAVVVGALNVKLPTFEHMFSIASALTWYKKPLIAFLTNKPQES